MRVLSWNINSLPPTLANMQLKYQSLKGYFDAHSADIVCFQEVKVPEQKITKDMACVEGYESFWSTSQGKQGYSGVTTWVRREYSPVVAHLDLMDGVEDMGFEGRIMVTDHAEFVLINVYVPNAGDKPARPRLDYKLQFLRALTVLMEDLVAQGRQVIAVGDFNVALSKEDVHSSIDFAKAYGEDELACMRALAGRFPDVWRYLHPNVTDTFTVWDEKTSARAFNAGQRIDFVLCSPSLLDKLVSCEVLDTPPKWSDHAALLLELRDIPPVPPHPPCALSSLKNKKLNDPLQRSIASMFVQPSSAKRTEEAGAGNSKQEPAAKRPAVASAAAASGQNSINGQPGTSDNQGKVQQHLAASIVLTGSGSNNTCQQGKHYSKQGEFNSSLQQGDASSEHALGHSMGPGGGKDEIQQQQGESVRWQVLNSNNTEVNPTCDACRAAASRQLAQQGRFSDLEQKTRFDVHCGAGTGSASCDQHGPPGLVLRNSAALGSMAIVEREVRTEGLERHAGGKESMGASSLSDAALGSMVIVESKVHAEERQRHAVGGKGVGASRLSNEGEGGILVPITGVSSGQERAQHGQREGTRLPALNEKGRGGRQAGRLKGRESTSKKAVLNKGKRSQNAMAKPTQKGIKEFYVKASSKAGQ